MILFYLKIYLNWFFGFLLVKTNFKKILKIHNLKLKLKKDNKI